jgi:AraC family transcriptional regulator of adaptative response / DNA-3-methyladenine glycosylase II
MDLDAARCYQALLSRDPRFDGRFFTAVLSTGIYCRPVCPARAPRPENVRFFSCAAAAEAAGFRPCRRCRPESAPGTPAWSGTGATVARALRLVADGALDHGSVEDLARRLGIGGRQLRRLFIEHLGATPRAVARTRRIHFARTLLDETGLSMADVAFASGFASVRQFNAAIKATFGHPPSALRARSRGSMGRAPEADRRGSFRLRLPYRPPLAWDALLSFLAPRAIPGIEVVDDRRYRRTIRLGEARGSIEVEPADDESSCLELRVEIADTGALSGIAARTRRLFDLDTDPMAISAHLGRDPIIAPLLVHLPGLRVPGAWDRFETAVRAILGQEVTVRGATTLAGRLVETFGEPAKHPRPGLTHMFPTPERLARTNLTSIGLPRARAETIRVFAAAVTRGDGILDGAGRLEAAVERMTGLPGIGEWTAHYVAMRALAEPDAFPASDLGLRRALAGGRRKLPSQREVLERAEAWRPWRAYAAMALWMSQASSPAQKRHQPRTIK